MKIRVTMKDPDTLYDAIDESLDEQLKDMPEDEAEALRDIKREKLTNIATEWFKYGEYLTVEIDTEEKTCVVIPAAEEV